MATESNGGEVANNECDTNADTCCLGRNFRIMNYTSRVADVYAYDKSIKPIENVPIVTGATAWTDPTTDTTYLLMFHESLYYGPKLDHSLINPNQIRASGIGFWDNPYDRTRGLNIELDEARVRLQTSGTKIYFESRAPTDQEIASCPRINMTSPTQWNPTTVSLKSVNTSKALKRRVAEIQTGDTIRFEYSEHDADETLLHSVAPSFTDLKAQMQEIMARDSSHYEMQDLPTRQTYTSTERHKQATAELLADRFGIGLQRARQMTRVTTQRGIRSAILPISIEHLRFKLRMFGVPISDSQPATYIYCDNDSVVKNSSRVDSTLNKKHSEVAYHFTRWNVTAQVCTIGWVETDYNIADAFTKRLAEKTRDFLFGEWTY